MSKQIALSVGETFPPPMTMFIHAATCGVEARENDALIRHICLL